MKVYTLEDGKKHIDNFNSSSNIVAQNWTDSLGTKFVKDLQEVSNSMNACLTKIEGYEATVEQVTNLFIQECGGSATADGTNYGLLEAMIEDIRRLLQSVVGDGSSDGSNRSGSGAHYSMGSASEGKSESYERFSNLDGTTLGGAPVYQQYDSEEYEQGSAKVKRR